MIFREQFAAVPASGDTCRNALPNFVTVQNDSVSLPCILVGCTRKDSHGSGGSRPAHCDETRALCGCSGGQQTFNPLDRGTYRDSEGGRHCFRQRSVGHVLADIGREWFAGATSEAEWAFKLSGRLIEARSVQDAFSAYQEWLGEGMTMFGEDSRRLMSDGRKTIDTGVRCFADTLPAATS